MPQAITRSNPKRTTFESLTPRRTDRAFLVGQTGSGKTTLARALLSTRKYVVVFDVKGTLNWSEYVVTRDFKTLFSYDPEKVPRIIYRPYYDELQDESVIDRLFSWVYRRRNTTIYVDETAGITRADTYPYHLGACLMRGREMGIETWLSTQRPTRIPMITMSEAEHFYIFRLQMVQDRVRIESMTGVPQEQIATLPKRRFYYAPQDDVVRGPLTLSL